MSVTPTRAATNFLPWRSPKLDHYDNVNHYVAPKPWKLASIAPMQRLLCSLWMIIISTTISCIDAWRFMELICVVSTVSLPIITRRKYRESFAQLRRERYSKYYQLNEMSEQSLTPAPTPPTATNQQLHPPAIFLTDSLSIPPPNPNLFLSKFQYLAIYFERREMKWKRWMKGQTAGRVKTSPILELLELWRGKSRCHQVGAGGVGRMDVARAG